MFFFLMRNFLTQNRNDYLQTMASLLHYFLHFVFPLFIAYLFFKSNWKSAYLLLLGTMIIDLDHLLATPIFQLDRCSIGFHPLHSYYIMPFYVGFCFMKRPYKIIGIGLLFHLLTDFIDCLFMCPNMT